MAEGSSEQSKFGQVFRKSWIRKGRKADLTDVSIGKIQEASKRGVRLGNTKTSAEGKVTAEVNKVVVQGDDK